MRNINEQINSGLGEKEMEMIKINACWMEFPHPAGASIGIERKADDRN